MILTYSQTTGDVGAAIVSPDHDPVPLGSLGTGYSGKGTGLDNPAAQDVKGKNGKPDAGPIPQGFYDIGPRFNYKKDAAHPHGTGPDSIRLTPDKGNQMFGRDGFLMHGDNSKHDHSASLGCVIAPDSVRKEVSTTSRSNFAYLWVTP